MYGAFQTSRDIFDNPIWQNIVQFRLFFLIYGKAMFADGIRVGNIVLKRGQWIRSIRNLQIDLEYQENNAIKQYSTSTLHRTIENLVKDERITKTETKLGTLFEVLNYNIYQGLENYESVAWNSNETATKQQRNNNKNYNNYITTTATATIVEISSFFEENGFGLMTPCIVDDMNSYLDDGIDPELIIAALRKSRANNIANWGYASRIIASSFQKGITSLEQFNADQVAFENEKKSTKQTQPKYQGKVPIQNTIDYTK